MKPFLLIACIACLLYVNTVSNGLIFDDQRLIEEQQEIRDPWDLGTIFGGRYWGEIKEKDPLYRPLTIWSLALNHRANRLLGLPGEHPAGYHLVNMLLHALVGCVLYRLLMQIGIAAKGSLATALLFVAHPIHTEAVAAIVNRSELLAALFGLTFLTLHARRKWIGAFCYLLAVWSKESAAVFFPLAIWTDTCPGGKQRKWPFTHYGSYGLVLVVWLGLRSLVIGDRSLMVPKLDNPLVEASLAERILTAGRVQFDYLRLQLWPAGLSSDYSFNQIPVVTGGLDPRFLGFVGLLIAALLASWILRKKHPVVAFSVIGYAVLFSPTSNFLFPIGTIMGERLAYAPSIFFCLLAGYGMWELYRRVGKPAAVLLALVLILYGGITVNRNRAWANAEVFYHTQVRTAPNSAKANYGSGREYLVARDFDRAAAYLRHALEISPDYAETWTMLGTVYLEKGDLRTAIRIFQEAIAKGAARSGLHYNLGRAYQLLGEYPLAVQSFLTAIRMDRTFIKPYINLGGVYFQTNRYPEARNIWKRALHIDPNNRTVRDNLDILETRLHNR